MPQQGKYSESDVEQQTPVVPPAATPDPGFFSTAGKQLAQVGKGIGSMVTGAPLPVQEVLPHALAEFIKVPGRELLGLPQPGASVLSAPQGLTDRLVGAGSAFFGGDPGAARMEFQAGHPRAAEADLFAVPATGALFGGLLQRFLPRSMASTAKRSNLLTKAAGATEGKAFDFPREFSVALPELDKTPPRIPFSQMKVSDLNNHVQDTFNRLEQDFNSRFFPISQQPVHPASIAQDLRALKRTAVTAEDIAWNQALERKALEFDRPMTWADVNQQRMYARDRVGDFYKQFPSTQGSKMGSNVDIVINDAINDSARDLVYNKLQQTYAGQVPPDYFRNLKRTESSLYNLKDQLGARTKQLSNMSAKSFLDRARVHSYVNPTGHVGAAVGGLAEAIFPEAASSNRAVRKAMTPKGSVVPALGSVAPAVGRRAEPSLAPSDEQ